MLPSPPITTTAKDSTTSSTAMSSEAAPDGTTSAPPTVPSMQPTVNTSANIFEALTPRPSAMSRFSAVARTMRPVRVRSRKNPSPTAMAMLAAMTSRL